MSFFKDLTNAVASRTLNGLIDAGARRLEISGIKTGGQIYASNIKQSVLFIEGNSQHEIKDWRVRITMSQALRSFFFTGILEPLAATNGVIFPYTPQISVSHMANYIPQRFTHSNYAHMFYETSEIQQIQIQTDFTAQNCQEADYVLACIYFFRSITKMFFGESNYAGNPPPLVFLNGYGQHYFPNVPCVITSFTHTMPPDADYISTSKSNNNNDLYYTNKSLTRIPTVSNFQVSLVPVYSKQNLAKFDLEKFARGDLLQQGHI